MLGGQIAVGTDCVISLLTRDMFHIRDKYLF